MENVLEIRNLSKIYPRFELKGVTFQVPAGSIMGLIGPNGAGKTTIIKLIMNLIRRDGGDIRLFGLDNLVREAEVKARTGFVYDTPAFFEDAAIKEIKAAIAPFYEKWNEPLFQELAAEFELPLKLKFRKLSQGMKTKFSLALALSHDADFIIMDEPTAGLDPVFRRELLAKLSGVIQNERKSILFSTHITSDLERIADYITFILNGEIVFSSAKDEILENWGVVKGARELAEGENRRFFEGISIREHGFEAVTSRREEAARHFGGQAVVERASLDDIMTLTARGGDSC